VRRTGLRLPLAEFGVATHVPAIIIACWGVPDVTDKPSGTSPNPFGLRYDTLLHLGTLLDRPVQV
jgi:hypothetical protein